MTAEFLDGMPRYPKMHPCGLVLSRQLMHELTPTFVANKGYSTTHFDMDAVEAIGLVKMDILAQGGLAAMRDVKAMLGQRGIEVNLEQCVAHDKADGRLSLGDPNAAEPWQDPKVWEITDDNVNGSLERGNAYAYYGWQPLDALRLIGGVTYDYLSYPENNDLPPLTSETVSSDLVSPKAGLLFIDAASFIVGLLVWIRDSSALAQSTRSNRSDDWLRSRVPCRRENIRGTGSNHASSRPR
jgi:hypothetical protein